MPHTPSAACLPMFKGVSEANAPLPGGGGGGARGLYKMDLELARKAYAARVAVGRHSAA